MVAKVLPAPNAPGLRRLPRAGSVAQFKVNLTSLLDGLNVFSHSLVRDNQLEIEYTRGDALQLR